jgi:hypothetical protein
LRFNKAKGRVAPDENTVRDVCVPCNSGPLFELDNYARGLYETHWSHIVRDQVTFEYKHVALTRWLLKVSFNAARQQKSDAASFDDLILYMRGKNVDPRKRIPDVIKPYEGEWGGENVVIEPHDHRCGKMGLSDIPSFRPVQEGVTSRSTPSIFTSCSFVNR